MSDEIVSFFLERVLKEIQLIFLGVYRCIGVSTRHRVCCAYSITSRRFACWRLAAVRRAGIIRPCSQRQRHLMFLNDSCYPAWQNQHFGIKTFTNTQVEIPLFLHNSHLLFPSQHAKYVHLLACDTGEGYERDHRHRGGQEYHNSKCRLAQLKP